MNNIFKIIALSLFITSCGASWHFSKAIKKGLVIEPEIVTVTTTDTVPGKDGQDSIVYRTVTVECPELNVPKTNTEVRQENKTKRNENDNATKLELAKLKGSTKQLKIENDLLKKKIKKDSKVKKTEIRQENKPKINVWHLILACIISLIIGLGIGKVL